jgi:hypothetical protein
MHTKKSIGIMCGSGHNDKKKKIKTKKVELCIVTWSRKNSTVQMVVLIGHRCDRSRPLTCADLFQGM